MTALLELEPRLAGNEIMEPEIEFEKEWVQLPVDCLISAPHQTLPATEGTLCC